MTFIQDFSNLILMNSKTTISIMVMAVSAFAMIAMPIILETDHAFAKSCPQHGCKGTHGYYYKGTHHHCYKGTKNCVNSKKHGYH
jgi:hypothetical protein